MLRHGRRQTRAARTRAIAKAQRAARTRDWPAFPYRQPWGRYAKRHYFDCGRPRCGLCHRGKHVGLREPTAQERRQLLRGEDA